MRMEPGACAAVMTKTGTRTGARTRRLLAGLAAAGAIAGCGRVGPAPGADPASVAEASQAASETYVIGPGDELGIFVYHAPDLTTDVPVRPDGRISIPLVQELVAGGKTPPQLADEITEALKKYVKDPTVTVTVKSFVGPFSRQIRVIGEATDPQAIPFREHMTVLDVMIATKGLTKFAAGNSAVIVRNVDGRQTSIKVRLADLIKDGDISQNVDVLPGDTLIIPQTWF
jgi:polysaccharide export outer membrane protein